MAARIISPKGAGVGAKSIEPYNWYDEAWGEDDVTVTLKSTDPRLDMVLAQNKLDMDKVYNERNRLVALLAHLFPSGLAPDVTTPDWLIIYIDLPTGQASWHVPVAEKDLFAGIPEYTKPWDDHTTAEKYRRIEKLAGTLTGFNVSITPQEI